MSTATNGIAAATKVKGLRAQLQKMKGEADAMIAEIKARQKEHSAKASAIVGACRSAPVREGLCIGAH